MADREPPIHRVRDSDRFDNLFIVVSFALGSIVGFVAGLLLMFILSLG